MPYPPDIFGNLHCFVGINCFTQNLTPEVMIAIRYKKAIVFLNDLFRFGQYGLELKFQPIIGRNHILRSQYNSRTIAVTANT
jgi:hypothetical protein